MPIQITAAELHFALYKLIKCVDELLTAFSSAAATNTPVDICSLAQRFTFEVISRVGFGEGFNSIVDKSAHVELLELLEEFTNTTQSIIDQFLTAPIKVHLLLKKRAFPASTQRQLDTHTLACMNRSC